MISYDYFNSELEWLQHTLVTQCYWKDTETSKEALRKLVQLKRKFESDLMEDNPLDDAMDNSFESFWNYINQKEDLATTTHFPEVDKMLKWKKGWNYAFTGYTNEGKSTLLYFLVLARILMEDAKIAVFSPENFPRKKFIKDWLKTMLGRKVEDSQREKIEKAYDKINNNLFYVYPDKHDIDSIEKCFAAHIKENGVDMCIIDPYLKISGQSSNVNISDKMSEYARGREVFCKSHNIIYVTVFHQLTARTDEKTGNYVQPDKYSIKGGGNTADGFDVVTTVWRPQMKQNPKDTTVIFRSVKVKDQAHFEMGEITMQYSLHSNRFWLDNRDLFKSLYEVF